MSMALFSSSPPPPTTLSALSLKHRLSFRTQLALFPRKAPSLLLPRSTDNGAGVVSSTATVAEEEEKDKLEEKKEETPPPAAAENDVESKQQSLLGSNGAAARAEEVLPPKFKDLRWVGGTWDLKRFQKDGKTDWDAVVDAEVRRRKWLEENPEASSNDEPVIFDTSIIPWWSWVKRFHLPEAELLNGRAAMIGFFMAYFVDSLTGVGLVDQMGNFFCKTLLFIAVAGVLLIRKNEDIDTLKKLLDETTFYDRQWQATWQEDKSSSDSKAK